MSEHEDSSESVGSGDTSDPSSGAESEEGIEGYWAADTNESLREAEAARYELIRGYEQGRSARQQERALTSLESGSDRGHGEWDQRQEAAERRESYFAPAIANVPAESQQAFGHLVDRYTGQLSQAANIDFEAAIEARRERHRAEKLRLLRERQHHGSSAAAPAPAQVPAEHQVSADPAKEARWYRSRSQRKARKMQAAATAETEAAATAAALVAARPAKKARWYRSRSQREARKAAAASAAAAEAAAEAAEAAADAHRVMILKGSGSGLGAQAAVAAAVAEAAANVERGGSAFNPGLASESLWKRLATERARHSQQAGEGWVCPECQVLHKGSVARCHNCGATREEVRQSKGSRAELPIDLTMDDDDEYMEPTALFRTKLVF
jgi:hypothetical protein